jgi:Mg2+-importing ATPase
MERLQMNDLHVDEALLTGEAYPAEKEVALPGAEVVFTSAFPPNLVFMGSSVVSGTAKTLILATGRETQLGSIAGTLRKEPPPTAFALGIQNFGMMIVRATVFLVLFVVLVNLLFHRPLLESFLFALALAVGLTPELLPMIVSVTLSHGSIRMSRKHVIVKRQSAIDDLGSMDVFCSDKTGTLTEARIKLIREVDLAGEESSAVMQLALLNAAFETGLKSPLDEAILAHGRIDLTDWRKIDEVPFDFQRRRVSILCEGGGRRLIVVKGAPEDVLRLATRYEQRGSPSRPLDAQARKTAEATFNALGVEGYRVLAVAWRQVDADRQSAGVADEADLTFAGFLAFLDPPKAGAREALTALANLGVAVKVVTGDNEQVTRHVCGELGLKITGMLSGPEVANLTDEALTARVDETTLFCRVTPPQKSRIIAALRRKGHVVGYLGDGINDAPPLHIADVGFSVNTAVDVAKEAAAIIRQHVLNGRWRSVPALPSDAADPNSSKQFALRSFGDSNSARQRERRHFGAASALGSRRHPQIHACFRSAEFSLRFRYFRTAALGLPGRRGAVSYRLVHRVAIDPDSRDLHHSNGSPPSGSPPCGTGSKFTFRIRHSGGTSLFAARALVRLRSITCRSHGCAGAGHHRLSNLRLSPKALVLCALQVELIR